MDRLPEEFARDLIGAIAYPAALHERLEPREAVCPQHGAFLSQGTRYLVGKGREVWTPCATCGLERKARELEAHEMERRIAEARRVEELLGRTAIPERFLSRTFENYRASTDEQLFALTAARAYAENFDQHAKSGESLVFLGNARTGKSHLAAAVLQAILPGHCGMYTTASDVIELVRSTWRRDSEQSQTKVLGLLASVPLLVIDEVGVQYGTESEQNIMFQIIDRRYRDRKPLMLMANLTRPEFEQMLGDRIFDRLREISSVVRFEWDSYRATARRYAL